MFAYLPRHTVHALKFFARLRHVVVGVEGGDVVDDAFRFPESGVRRGHHLSGNVYEHDRHRVSLPY